MEHRAKNVSIVPASDISRMANICVILIVFVCLGSRTRINKSGQCNHTKSAARFRTIAWRYACKSYATGTSKNLLANLSKLFYVYKLSALSFANATWYWKLAAALLIQDKVFPRYQLIPAECVGSFYHPPWKHADKSCKRIYGKIKSMTFPGTTCPSQRGTFWVSTGPILQLLNKGGCLYYFTQSLHHKTCSKLQ